MIKKAVPGKMGLLALIATTYCMVAGGPFGLEDLVQKTGYSGTIIILFVTALIWALPTALMVAELASAIPEEGGFYAWVKRALGPFWGFQEAWLTFAGSIFDMAIYPTLFAWYIARMWPALEQGHWPVAIGVLMIATCVFWNIYGARAVGSGSLLFSVVLLSPFAVIVIYALTYHGNHVAVEGGLRRTDLFGGILIAMWNYMGWDNTSTIAEEVERPERTYPLAMLGATLVVSLTYIIPIAALSRTGIDPNSWSTGGWVDVARILGGRGLALAIMLAGAIGAFSTFNALVLSLSRLPLAMSRDGFLPKVFGRCNRYDVPWVSIVVCSTAWAFALGLGFDRIVMLDVLLTGLSILLEFAALVALRIREPNLTRPVRVPGGVTGTVILGLAPTLLIGISVVRNRAETIGPINALTLGLILIAFGWLLYLFAQRKHSLGDS